MQLPCTHRVAAHFNRRVAVAGGTSAGDGAASSAAASSSPAAASPSRLCPLGHQLVFGRCSARQNLRCDGPCGCTLPPASARFSCALCDFDACEACARLPRAAAAPEVDAAAEQAAAAADEEEEVTVAAAAAAAAAEAAEAAAKAKAAEAEAAPHAPEPPAAAPASPCAPLPDIQWAMCSLCGRWRALPAGHPVPGDDDTWCAWPTHPNAPRILLT